MLEQGYKKEFTIKIPAELSGSYLKSLEDVNKTPSEKRKLAKKTAKTRIGKSVIRSTAKVTFLQLATEYWVQNRQHNISMVQLRDGNTYKSQVKQIGAKYQDIFINSARSSLSAYLISGFNPVVALSVFGVSTVGGAGQVGIEAGFSNERARIERQIDSLNVDRSRRALSISSTYGNRNINNRGVMY
jgi:hypothetical protein